MSLKPQLAGLTNRRCLARCDMDTLADIDCDFSVTRIGVFLAREGLNMPLVVDGVIDDPRLFLLAPSCCPHPLANRHDRPLSVAVRNKSQYVANSSAGQGEAWTRSRGRPLSETANSRQTHRRAVLGG